MSDGHRGPAVRRPVASSRVRAADGAVVGEPHDCPMPRGRRRGSPSRRARVRRDEEAGAVTLWMLGLVLLVLTAGALSVDLWQAVAVRSELAGRAEAAVAAGASGVALEVFRGTGDVVLDPELAAARAAVPLGPVAPGPNGDRPWGSIVVADRDITVTVTTRVRPVLLRLLDPDAAPIEVTVTRTAEARLD